MRSSPRFRRHALCALASAILASANGCGTNECPRPSDELLTRPSGFYVADPGGGPPELFAPGTGGGRLSPDWSRVVWAEVLDWSDAAHADPDILVADANGRERRNLTPGPWFDMEPSWSPDGTMIAFRRDGDIWAMKADGTSQHEVVDTGEIDLAPVWSPDGTRLGFTSFPASGAGPDTLWVVDLDGTDLTRLVEQAGSPTWSPDGRRLAFVRGTGQTASVFVANVDGSGLRELVKDAAEPAWSPDGTRIAYLLLAGGCDDHGQVWAIDVDGAHATRLTRDPVGAHAPTWSKDGARLAYWSGPAGVPVD